MEKNPEKPKPVKDNCNNCKKNYKLTADNTVAMTYPNKPECNHIVCQCPNCQFLTAIYIPEGSDTIERVAEHGVTISELDWPSDAVYNGWLEVMGIELIQPQALTPRQEKPIEFFHYLLQGEITVENFL